MAPMSQPVVMGSTPPPQVSQTGFVGNVRPAGWYGPYPQVPLLVRWWWLPAALLAVAAGLIMANSVALLSSPFFSTWSAFMPWLTTLGSFGFILGIMLGLVLVGAIIMIFLKFKILAAFIIFPTAIVSIFAGGGFILGAVLAVLAGILLLL